MTWKKCLTWGIVLGISALLLCPTLKAEENDDIKLPAGPYYTETNPGPWKDQIQAHIPVVTTKTRKSGLELIRIVEVSVPHPIDKKNTIMAIYVTDKDGIFIGYKAFTYSSEKLSGEFTINGVINYFEVYVQCAKHGVWKKTFRL
jgi:desulfoferrodoxin (superoxide reductase-like protein)